LLTLIKNSTPASAEKEIAWQKSEGNSFSQDVLNKAPELQKIYNRFLAKSKWLTSANGIIIKAPTSFHAARIKHFTPYLESALGNSIHKIEVDNNLREGITKNKSALKQKLIRQTQLPLAPKRVAKQAVTLAPYFKRQGAPTLISSPALNPLYELVKRWSKNLGKSWEPQILWLHGEGGVGKTHLLKQLNSWVAPDKKLLFVDVLKFLSEWRESLEKKRNFEFINKYRKQVDVLVIENIDLLRNKKGTQQELLFTLNHLAERGGAVALSSLESPNDLKEYINESLFSRFMSGLTLEFPAVDQNFKESLWQHMLDMYNLKDVAINTKLVHKLLDLPSKTVRQCKSLFTKTLGYISIEGTLDQRTIERLEFQVLGQRPEIHSRAMLSPKSIIERVCSLCGVHSAAIQGNSRRGNISLARRFIYLSLSKHLGMSNSEISSITQKDPSTICHALRAIEKEIEEKRHILEQWNWICDKLKRPC